MLASREIILTLAVILVSSFTETAWAQKPAAKSAGSSTAPAALGELEEARQALARGDEVLATDLLDKAVSEGNKDALVMRGRIFETSTTRRDLAKAADLYRRGSLLGEPECQFAYARFLVGGLGGVEKDEEKGRQLIKTASDKGSVSAQIAYAAMLERGEGVEKNEKAAFELYQKAAERKHPEALLAVALFHDKGLGGVTKDEAKGLQYCREAANLGSAVAANEMGVRYQRGLGIVQDNVAAVGWFHLAAQKGVAAAQVNLGNIYETGNGAVQDERMAEIYYKQAADSGNPLGMLLLGNLRLKSANLDNATVIDSYVLICKAAAAGVEDAIKLRDALKPKLSADQLAAAEKQL